MILNIDIIPCTVLDLTLYVPVSSSRFTVDQRSAVIQHWMSAAQVGEDKSCRSIFACSDRENNNMFHFLERPVFSSSKPSALGSSNPDLQAAGGARRKDRKFGCGP